MSTAGKRICLARAFAQESLATARGNRLTGRGPFVRSTPPIETFGPEPRIGSQNARLGLLGSKRRF